MNHKVGVVVVGLVAVGAATAFLMHRHDDAPALRLTGTIEARDVEVGSQVGGRVAVVHVDEGDTVPAGGPVVTLETDLLDPQIDEQTAKLAEARARLELLVRGPRAEDVVRARLEWENAETERARMERLLKGGAASQQQYDSAQTRAALLREVLRALENGSRAEDIAAARAAVAREQGHLAYLEQRREESVVRAPSEGVVQTIDLNPGDLVSAGAPVARLLAPGDLWVRGYIPEPQLGRVHVGQHASVAIDTWPDRVFTGRVVEIRDRGEYTPRNIQTISQRADQVFAVKVVLDPSPELKAGMAAIVTLEERAAPTTPAAAAESVATGVGQ